MHTDSSEHAQQYKTPDQLLIIFLLFHSCKFIVVDCKQGQLQCPRQALKGEFRKKLKEDSKLYEVFKTKFVLKSLYNLESSSTLFFNVWCPQRNVRNTFQLITSEQRKPTQEMFWD